MARLPRLLLSGIAAIAAVIALSAVVLIVTAQFWLKGWLESTVEARTGRELHIGTLSVAWSLQPLLVGSDVSFANADWTQEPEMLSVDKLAVRVALLPLLHGRPVLPELRLHHARLLLQRGPDGRVNWNFREQPSTSERPLPEIDHLTISDSEIRFTETNQQTDLTVRVTAESDAPEGPPLEAHGAGRWRGQPFTLAFQGDSPLCLVSPDCRYELNLRVAAGDTEAILDGGIRDPRLLKTSDLDLTFSLSGPDPADLQDLVDLPLPSLPPYSVSGDLARRSGRWTLSGFHGSVGDSDLEGDMSLVLGAGRPVLTADLHSEKLDFDDLGGLVGATPSTDPGETASPEQREEAREDSGLRALPDEPFEVAQLQSVDAEVRFRGEHVSAGKLPVDEVDIDFKLQHGKMHFQPLAFRAGGGELRTRIDIDTSGEELDARLEGEFLHLDLARLFAGFDIMNDSLGQIGGRTKLWMRGDSIAALLAHADGGLYLIMTGGRLDRILVELAGLDIGEAVMADLGEGKQSIPIECGYADMQFRDGLLDLEKVVIDSTDTLFTADGTLNLETEQLDVKLSPQPKDASILAARSELHIGGTLADPSVLPGAATLVKGAAAAALAAVTGPAAALVPLVETGGGEDSVSCASLTRSVNAGDIGAEQEKGGRR